MKLDDVLRGSYQRYIAADFLSTLFFDKRIPLVIDGSMDTQAVSKKLLDCYGDVPVTAECDGRDIQCKASALPEGADTLIVDGCALTDCERFGFSELVSIMKRLRAKDGCEWDRAQTHESIRVNLVEEAYELVEAIDKNSAPMMREECGDVLMQAVFHTEIADSQGEFGYYDMLTELCRKLIDRHTHIFGTNHANNPEEALAFWNAAKKKEKKYASTSDAMDRIPKNLPSLLYAEKVQRYAKKDGFDWKDVSGAVEKLKEETEEFVRADEAHKREEAGDLLFAAVNVLRLSGLEAEMTLREASNKFLRRYAALEAKALATGRQMTDFTLEELDALWEEVKREEEA